VTITLNLPSELEEELSQEAARLGLPLSEYAVRVLAGSRASQIGGNAPLTGPELVEYWNREGVIGSRRDIEDPVAFARELRERNQNRTRS
jgi:hypothetical protein